MILSDKAYRDSIERIYIHEVQPRALTYAKLEETRQGDKQLFGSGGRKSPQQSKICYFGTYIDAAIDAYVKKLILVQGLRRIMEGNVISLIRNIVSCMSHINCFACFARPSRVGGGLQLHPRQRVEHPARAHPRTRCPFACYHEHWGDKVQHR